MNSRWITLGSMAVLLAGSLLMGCTTASRSGSRVGAHPGRNGGQDDPLESEAQVEAAAHYAAGLSFDLNDQPEQALAEMILAAEADPSSESLVVEAARRCLRAQKADRAVSLLSKATSYPDASGTLYAWLGLAYSKSGRTDLAITANRTAIRKEPDSIAPYQNLAQLYLQTSRTNEALAVLDEAAGQTVNDAGFLMDLAELYLRYARVQAGQTTAIRARVRSILDRAASSGETLDPLQALRLADAYFALGELEKAEPFYRRLLEEHPDLPSLREKLAEIYLRGGEKGKASKQLEMLARTEPTNPQTQLLLGALAADEKKWDEAADRFEQALKLDPDLEQVYYDLAGLKLTLEKPEEALAVLDRARQRFKLSYWMEFYTGLAYRDAEKFKEALTHLTSAEAIAKATDPARLNHMFYFQMGSAYERAGQLDDAEKYFREALQLEPDDPETLNYLGYMWAEHGIKLEEAKQLIERALKVRPDTSAFLDSLAWVLFKLERPEEALPAMLKAIEKSEKSDPTLFDHLGDIYAALHQHERAREAWEKALQVKPNEQIQRKLDALRSLQPSTP